MAWKPKLGAVPGPGATRFRVWAPKTEALAVRIEGGGTHPLRPEGGGYFGAEVPGVRAGARYLFRFPDGRERPDPASLLQPAGVHGPSEVVDLAAFAPRTRPPRLALEQLVFSEIHLGTFTRAGTADAAGSLLPLLAEAEFTAVEVMPIAAFPGSRNWGYDGAAPFAAHAAYGGPEALARLVDAAHAQRMVAFLDVVYNHLGPEGNYLGEFGPYFTSRHKTPWGDALDFSLAPVRRYFVENGLRWVAAAGGGFDGLRLDAVHGIVDDSEERGGVHILRELNEAVQREARETGRSLWVIAESDLNEARLVEDPPRGDGLASAWADDLHHALHVALTGERTGYYADFAPPAVEPLEALATSLREGWLYSGRQSAYRGRPHGTPAAHLPGRRFVSAAQNHDQIGNRARGERLVSLTSAGGARIATALVALAPSLPLFFMGEEWGAREPFQYFVSHGDPALVEAVRRGRREEFKAFEEFADGADIPDPQAEETFVRSRLDWSRRDTPSGAAALRWHRSLLQLRREHPALRDDSRSALEAQALRSPRALLLRRFGGGAQILLVALFEEAEAQVALPGGAFRVLLDSGADASVFGGKEARLDGARLSMCGRQAVVLEAVAP
jgi:maltooligosyltrehalose trehalohydrolase